MSERPTTHYARSGGAHVAYQALGEGPVDLVMTPGFISHLDLQWESVAYRRFVRQLAAHARVVRYDKRGTGLSDPVPTLEQRVDDLNAVMDAAGSARALVLGYSEGGPTAIRFAGRMRVRTLGLILYGTSGMPPPPDIARRFREPLAVGDRGPARVRPRTSWAAPTAAGGLERRDSFEASALVSVEFTKSTSPSTRPRASQSSTIRL